MMKIIIWIIILVLVVFAIVKISNKTEPSDTTPPVTTVPVTVTPVTHASAILEWDGSTIYTDPTGTSTVYLAHTPNITLVTDIHGDHFSTSTLSRVLASSTLIVPQAVRDLLPIDLTKNVKVLKNGETITEQGFGITAIPMYNLPESSDSRHTKGRGNGYVIEKDGYKVYIAGDTAGIPEMRTLADIDMAFIPMNLPYTMGVEEAASAVLDFKPKIVYPYHYRGQDGLADVNRFKELVDAGDEDIEVKLLNWYP